MGCCCSKDGSDVDSLDEPLVGDRYTDSESGSIAGSRYEDDKIGPQGTILKIYIVVKFLLCIFYAKCIVYPSRRTISNLD